MGVVQLGAKLLQTARRVERTVVTDVGPASSGTRRGSDSANIAKSESPTFGQANMYPSSQVRSLERQFLLPDKFDAASQGQRGRDGQSSHMHTHVYAFDMPYWPIVQPAGLERNAPHLEEGSEPKPKRKGKEAFASELYIDSVSASSLEWSRARPR